MSTGNSFLRIGDFICARGVKKADVLRDDIPLKQQRTPFSGQDDCMKRRGQRLIASRWEAVFAVPEKVRPLLLALTFSLLFTQLGCRSLRSGRHTKNLSEARQWSLRGAGSLQAEDYDEAGSLFGEALSRSSADERAQWGMAEVLWHGGKQQQAIEHMGRAAELSGNNPDLLVRLGEMHHCQANWEEAIKQADLAISINRQHPEAWALRGRVLRSRNRIEEALDCYQRALIHNSSNSEARVAVAEIYHTLGRPQRALATLDQLADNQPTEAIPARAWMLKGQALADLGERGDAKDCLRQAALCAEGNDAEIMLDLARLQFETGELAEARVCLGRALQNNPQDPEALQLQQVLDRSFDHFSDRNRTRAIGVSLATPVESDLARPAKSDR